MVVGAGEEFCLAADQSPRRWCSLYIPNEKLAARNVNTTTALASMRGVFHLPRQRIERFRSAIEQLDEAVQRAPASFDSAAAQAATEEKLGREIRNVLAMPREVERALGGHEGSATIVASQALWILSTNTVESTFPWNSSPLRP